MNNKSINKDGIEIENLNSKINGYFDLASRDFTVETGNISFDNVS